MAERETIATSQTVLEQLNLASHPIRADVCCTDCGEIRLLFLSEM